MYKLDPKPFIVVCYLLLLFVTAPSLAYSNQCPPKLYNQAEKAMASLDSWQKVYQFYSRFRVCDDGGNADDLTESIVRLLVDRWKEVSQFGQLAHKNPGFKAFVLLHIDSTADTDDLYKIQMLSSQHCPQKYLSLCKEISASVHTALQ